MSDQEIDRFLNAGLDKEGLIRMKAVEYTIEFLKEKQITKFETFDDVFERIYKSLKNGTEQQ